MIFRAVENLKTTQANYLAGEEADGEYHDENEHHLGHFRALLDVLQVSITNIGGFKTFQTL